MDEERVKALISDLKEYYRSYELTGQNNTHIANLLKDSANMLDELRSLVVRSVGFYNTEEDAKIIRDISEAMGDLCERARDPEWQKVHKEMGFMSPLADIYEEFGNG